MDRHDGGKILDGEEGSVLLVEHEILDEYEILDTQIRYFPRFLRQIFRVIWMSVPFIQ